ncbi:MAG: hypothetical protein MI892_27505, partial [Desulfobacterales bacterium]|nr:hypothetical protein [Desulfobacterales bacterium]
FPTVGPYSWKVRGQGFYTNKACTERDAITSIPVLKIYTKNSCGVCAVYVTDGCSSDTGEVLSTVGGWVAVAGVNICQPDVFAAYNLFECSFFGVTVEAEIPARFGRHALTSDGAETMVQYYNRTSWYCGLWAGPLDGPNFIIYNPPDYPSVDVPIQYSPQGYERQCAGDNAPPGIWKPYKRSGPFTIYEYLCP